MSERDHLAIVSYDTKVTTNLQLTRMDAVGKAQVLSSAYVEVCGVTISLSPVVGSPGAGIDRSGQQYQSERRANERN